MAAKIILKMIYIIYINVDVLYKVVLLMIMLTMIVFWMMFILHHSGFWEIQNGCQDYSFCHKWSLFMKKDVLTFILIILLEDMLLLDTYSE